MEIAIRTVIIGVVVLIVVFLVILMISNLSGEGVNVMESFAKYMQGVITGLGG